MDTSQSDERMDFDLSKLSTQDITLIGIILQGKLFNSDQVVKVANCYGLYLNRLQYRSLIKAGGLLNERGLIMGGDLNFTV